MSFSKIYYINSLANSKLIVYGMIKRKSSRYGISLRPWSIIGLNFYGKKEQSNMYGVLKNLTTGFNNLVKK